MRDLLVVVHGHPAPQGSKRHVGNGRIIEASPHLKAWRHAVTLAAIDATHHNPWMPPPAAEIRAVFALPRPRAHYRANGQLRPNAPEYVTTRPDIDKLQRSTLDALVDAGVLSDDATVASITAVKMYATGAVQPGVVLIVRGIT